MTVKPNGTDAKDIALHFVAMTSGRAAPTIMAKTINQAKALLSSGYTREEILKTIDYIIVKKKINMYSLGYVSSAINDVLKELDKIELELVAKKLKQQIITSFAEGEQKEVDANGDSAQRNRDKSTRFGLQSGERTKSYFDLLKE